MVAGHLQECDTQDLLRVGFCGSGEQSFASSLWRKKIEETQDGADDSDVAGTDTAVTTKVIDGELKVGGCVLRSVAVEGTPAPQLGSTRHLLCLEYPESEDVSLSTDKCSLPGPKQIDLSAGLSALVRVNPGCVWLRYTSADHAQVLR